MASAESQAQDAARHLRQTRIGATRTNGAELRPQQHRQGPVPLLERYRHVGGQPVEGDGEHDEAGAERGGARVAQFGEEDRRPSPGTRCRSRSVGGAPGRRRIRMVRPDRGGDRDRAVDHARHRRVDPLLGDREQRQGDGRSRRSRARRPGGDRTGSIGRRAAGTRARAPAPSTHPGQRHHPGSEGVEADRHEEERRAPDEGDAGEQRPSRRVVNASWLDAEGGQGGCGRVVMPALTNPAAAPESRCMTAGVRAARASLRVVQGRSAHLIRTGKRRTPGEGLEIAEGRAGRSGSRPGSPSSMSSIASKRWVSSAISAMRLADDARRPSSTPRPG